MELTTEKTLGQQRPYTLIETDDPNATLGEGRMSDWPTLSEATSAYVQSTAPFKQVIYDDDIVARELNKAEQDYLNSVCQLHGLDVQEIELRPLNLGEQSSN